MKSFPEVSKAFTLVEMLVVIAIIGMLAALLLPALARSKLMAQRSVCISNLKQIGLAVKMYANDHGDVLPASATPPADYWKTNGIDVWNVYKSYIKSYVGLKAPSSPEDKIFACPSDNFYATTGEQETFNNAPLHEQARSDYSSYDYNTGNLKTNYSSGTTFYGIAGQREGFILEPTKTILVGEMPAWLPFSWHKRQKALQFNNAMNQLCFVDGHVGYVPIYWNSNKTNSGTFCYDPPAGYEYRWSGR